MFSKSTDCLYFNCCGFRFRFYHVLNTLLNTRKMKLFGLSSLLGCAFFRIRLGIPGVIACSTFQVTFFCFFEEIFSAEMIPAAPRRFYVAFTSFVTFFVGGGGYFTVFFKTHLKVQFFQYNFSGCFYYDGVRYFITLFCFLLNIRRSESLLFITIFEVLNVNNYIV